MHTEFKINSYNSFGFYSDPETPFFLLSLFMSFSGDFYEKLFFTIDPAQELWWTLNFMFPI